MIAKHGQIEWFNSIFASGKENIQPARAEKLSNGIFLAFGWGCRVLYYQPRLISGSNYQKPVKVKIDSLVSYSFQGYFNSHCRSQGPRLASVFLAQG
jgi:hypothetical protein